MKTIHKIIIGSLILLLIITIAIIILYFTTETPKIETPIEIHQEEEIIIEKPYLETNSTETILEEETNKLPSLDNTLNTFVSKHNEIRSQVGQSPIKWSDEIAKGAQTYANKCIFSHSTNEERKHNNNILGENLGMGSPYASYSDSNIIDLWIAEKNIYNYPDPPNTKTGHYTQMVNKNVTEIGCGCSLCGNKKMCVCRYNPIQISAQKPY